jgi:carbon storage regulator
MLVMSRREGETILIGDEVEVVIARIGRSRVKVGIRAPRETPVIAREVKLIRDENLRAAGATASDLATLIARLDRSDRLNSPAPRAARFRRRT